MPPSEMGAEARTELLDRRRKLEDTIPLLPDPAPLRRLLREVDEALERIADGTFGLCAVCHDPIEADRLATDPLIRNCIDHLTASEQRALERDLDLSARIQSALLPARQVHHDEWEVVYHYEPHGAVSGDYCDVLTPPDTYTHVLVGDVSGKGVAASLLMAYLHATFRSLVGLGLELAEMVERANRLLCESTGGHNGYATLACVRALPRGVLEVLNAGHCPPLHVSAASGALTSVAPSGLPLGLFCNSPYSVARICLDPGDTLILYTDGVTESRNRADEELGETRLIRSIEARRSASAFELVQGCLDDLTAFRSGVPRTDDLTLLALRRNARA